MPLSPSSILDIVELVSYAPLAPILIYLAWCHGRHTLFNYFCLLTACAVRSISDIVSLVTSAHSSSPSVAASVLSSVGLTPLLLALAGFTHEAHLAFLSTRGNINKSTKRWLLILQLHIHAIAIVGIVLIIIGNVKLQTTKNITASDTDSDNVLRETGAMILLALSIGLLMYAAWVFHLWRSTPYRGAGRRALAKYNVIAALLILIKIIYNVLYVFDRIDEQQLSPIDGPIGIKVIFTYLLTLAVVIALTVGGWKSRGRFDGRPYRRQDQGHFDDGSDTDVQRERSHIVTQKA